jgi:hypothetical protein
MMSPKLTVGMATFNDFEGVWATVQSVYLHNQWEDPKDVEIVIVDTSPQGSEHRRLVQGLVEKHKHTHLIKYIDLPQVVGTTYPRDIIFEHATADYVVVMDCHVMCPTNTLLRLSAWFDQNPNCTDLLHGPMFYDDLDNYAVSFNDMFRGQMWGVWGSVWKAPDGTLFTTDGEEVTDEDRPRKSTNVQYRDNITFQLLPSQERFPQLGWSGHDQKLEAMGYTKLGKDPESEPFEISGMGMGLFASRRDAWLGFAPHCSGFGGEEMNIHYKYRAAGRRAMCLPFLRWNHRFGRAGGAPYPIPVDAKIRNYVLWAKHLGNPICPITGTTVLERVFTHFANYLPQESWDRLLSDPINYNVNLTAAPVSTTRPLDALLMEVATKPRDLDQHVESIRNLVYKTQSVVAFVKRAEWEPILAAGFPNTLVVYQSEKAPLTERCHAAHKQQSVKDSRQLKTYTTHTGAEDVDPLNVPPVACDLLVIDKHMRGDYITKVLAKHGPLASKFILIRGTGAFGETSEYITTEPGLFAGIKEFLHNNPNWFVYHHTATQYGYTVLSCIPSLLPENEIRPWPLGYGPGTELKAILSSVGINPGPNCSCRARMRAMDEMGIDGCEQNFDTIVGWLQESAEAWGWNTFITKKAEEPDGPSTLSLGEKITVGWKSLTSGLAFHINPLNPYPGLVKEAINRSKRKAEK